MRPQQWYKNVFVFLPIFFAQQFHIPEKVWLTILGFIALCAISSTNYIINDIVDIKKDRKHTEKKKRPLAARTLSVSSAIILALLLAIVSLSIAWSLGMLFVYAIVFLFFFTQLYSFVLKHEVFADIIAISINTTIRAIAGAFIISVPLSNWLIIGIFFWGLFTASAKRHGDVILLGKKAVLHKKTLKEYTPHITTALMTICTTVLVFSYVLYAFLNNQHTLIVTIPFSLYTFFRYYSLTLHGSPIARHPEKVFTDSRLVTSMILWTSITALIIYV